MARSFKINRGIPSIAMDWEQPACELLTAAPQHIKLYGREVEGPGLTAFVIVFPSCHSVALV